MWHALSPTDKHTIESFKYCVGRMTRPKVFPTEHFPKHCIDSTHTHPSIRTMLKKQTKKPNKKRSITPSHLLLLCFGCLSVGLDDGVQPSLLTRINEHPMILSPDNHHFFLGTFLTDTDHWPSITIHKSCSCLAITVQPLLKSLRSSYLSFFLSQHLMHQLWRQNHYLLLNICQASLWRDNIMKGQ